MENRLIKSPWPPSPSPARELGQGDAFGRPGIRLRRNLRACPAKRFGEAWVSVVSLNQQLMRSRFMKGSNGLGLWAKPALGIYLY